jgi:hypothetical protein
MHRTIKSPLALVALVGIAACAPPPAPADSGDAGRPADVATDTQSPTDTSVGADTPAPTDTGVEDAASPADSGVEPMDSGVAPEDTGVQPTDTGVAPTDTGVAPTDTGVAPADTGVPPMDSGVGPTDSGIDTGIDARTDSGVGPTDSGIDTGIDVRTDSGVDTGVDVRTDTGVDTGVMMPDSGLPPGAIGLTNATADFSQSGFSVAEMVNGIPTGDNDGWAITGGGTARTAVFETSVDTTNYSGGTDLTFNIAMNSTLGSGPYLLGRFRFSVTTADRAMFADGLANGGNLGAPAIWSVARVVSATATNGATLAAQSDQSVLLGTRSSTSVYTVRIRTPFTRITGVKLETLTHPSLMNNGPGTSNSGNFIVTEMTMTEAAAPIPATASVAFGAPPSACAASLSQTGYPVTAAIDGALTPTAGWAIDTGSTNAQTAVFETLTNTPAYGGVGSRLVVTLHQLFGNNHTIGRFRLSVTNANRAMFADGLNNGGNLGPAMIWTPVDVRAVAATTGAATFAPQSDGSIRATSVSVTATYQVTVTTPLEGITGVRLETLTDPLLPTSGPGNTTTGNYVLTEVQLASGPQI